MKKKKTVINSNLKFLPDNGKIAVFNRGEAASRFLRGLQDYNSQYGTSIKGVLYLQEDDHLNIKDDNITVKRLRNTAKPYHVDKELIEVFLGDKINAVWPGWGFASENPLLPELLCEAGILFIGPDHNAIRKLGDKIESKLLAEQEKISVIPWVMSSKKSELSESAEKIGYPLILKASGGGGGRGIRIVNRPEEFDDALSGVMMEAPGDIFMEKYLSGGRHIEVQIFADAFGNISTFGLRECSLQRRRQKVIEEAPAPGIGEKLAECLQNWAAILGKAVNYFSAGTVEYMLDSENQPWFLEMNPRLQVEHGVTEEAFGIDLVSLQLRAAQGYEIREKTNPVRHAFEARIYAEDPIHDFLPAPGVISHLHYGTGPGIRIDGNMESGDNVSSKYDPMIAKIISVGSDRLQSLARLKRSINETKISIDGGSTNLEFISYLISRDEFKTGKITTDLTDRLLLPEYKNIPEELFLPCHLATSILEHSRREQENVNNFAIRPLLSGIDEPIDFLNMKSQVSTSFKVQRLDIEKYLVSDKNGNLVFIHWKQDSQKNYASMETYKGNFLFTWEYRKGEWRTTINGYTLAVRMQEKGVVRSPSPSIVTSVHVKVGDEVKEGQKLFTLEAMKMELIVFAQESGNVEKVEVHPGSQVFAGGTLLRMTGSEPHENNEMTLDAFASPPSYSDAIDMVHGALFGYECSDKEIDTALKILASTPESLLENAVNMIYRELILTGKLFEVTSPQRIFPVVSGQDKLGSGRALLSVLIRRPSGMIHSLPDEFKNKLIDIIRCFGAGKMELGYPFTYALYRLRNVLNTSSLKRRALVDLLTFLSGFEKPQLPSPPSELYEALHIFSIDVKGSTNQTDLAESIRSFLYEIPSVFSLNEKMKKELSSYLSGKKFNESTIKDALLKLPSEDISGIEKISSQTLMKNNIPGILVTRYWGEYVCSCSPVKDIPYATTSFTVFDDNSRESGTRYLVIYNGADDFETLIKSLRNLSGQALEIVCSSNNRCSGNESGIFNKNAPGFREIVLTTLETGESRIFRSPIGSAYVEDLTLCGLHPASARRMKLWRFSDFRMKRISFENGVHLFEAKAGDVPEDKRIVAFSEVTNPMLEQKDGVKGLPEVENAFRNACQSIRNAQFGKSYHERLHWNHLIMHVSPLPTLTEEELKLIAMELTPHGARLGLEQVTVYSSKRVKNGIYNLTFKIRGRGNEGFHFDKIPDEEYVVKPLNEEEKQEIKARRKGLNSPQSILRIISRDLNGKSTGKFLQYEILIDPSSGEQHFFQMEERSNLNQSIVFGVLSIPVPSHPDGLERVVIISNPLKNMGSLSEEECRRIIAALELAEKKHLSVYWLPVSAGAKIDFNSGTENLDWTAKVLRKIVDFTENEGIIDILVAGVNVGAQSYFDAEATMINTTKGFLVMTQDGSMVLTGKRALDFSGAISAEDNLGIGGGERIMGPTGQAQALVDDLADGHHLLLEHASLVIPNLNNINKILSKDSDSRDISSWPYPFEFNHSFSTVGAIFDETINPGRKRQFSVKPVMDATKDTDAPLIDRWSFIGDGAEGVFVWETRIGGIAVGFLGIDASSTPRIGVIPPDGPESWSPSTLFPRGSYKLARGINAFNGQMPLIIFANLSGFDGSPESLRKWQLVHGAEIGRAMVNFKGPVLLVVLSRYHGGAYVVFSTALNDSMEAVALKGSFASVIGGKAAANVVFASQTLRQIEKNPEVISIKKKINVAKGREKIILEAELIELRTRLNAELSNELAENFDTVHSVERAARVGSLKSVIEPSSLRQYIIDFLRSKTGIS
ncbi:MAG: biotin/lipoyl-binding protein [Deltaproteobacteria bacterium]|nr:biotin/lipoyl-binding protein [Deltaproteobacteria bacterium]